MRNILTKLMLLIVASAVYVSPIFAKEVGVEPISLKLLSAWTDLEQSSLQMFACKILCIR